MAGGSSYLVNWVTGMSMVLSTWIITRIHKQVVSPVNRL